MERGWVTIAAILVMAVALLYVTALSAMSSQEYTMALYSAQEMIATYAAESGMEVMRSAMNQAVDLLNSMVQAIKSEREVQGRVLTKPEVYSIVLGYMSNWCEEIPRDWIYIYSYSGKYKVERLEYYDYNPDVGLPHILFLQVKGMYNKSNSVYNGIIQLNVEDGSLAVRAKIFRWGKVY
ncbi:pilus assembly PilX N-terminal domain-containing protein [Caldanaerobius polysaccharolyticus]|uniref:pilus assembly PilX N-terminal domain-containing protein n=1 Tax=Caldanaerobius polysaccharolyticus TaxID=44256 RepID=UPI0004792A90|nr:pilus assembly PilX N-terminal domain-containing protein [Caldanaerobius polysaccharolyticus]